MTTGKHPVELLFAATGLWDTTPNAPLPAMPVGGVMVLGHDFHSESGFEESLRADCEVDLTRNANGDSTIATLRALLPLLREAGIQTSECFFTNAYMGLREGQRATGAFLGARDKSFVERCGRFLLKQIALQRPRVILALGISLPRFLAPLAYELRDWADVRTFSRLDDNSPVRHGVRFASTDLPCSVVVLTHPSFRTRNVWRRRLDRLKGPEAEMTMIATALAGAKTSDAYSRLSQPDS